jgi:DNA sulfur modification protein DndD
MASEPIVLDLTADARGQLTSLLSSELTSTQDRIRSVLESERDLAESLDHIRDRLEASPNADAIAEIVAARASTQTEVARLAAEQAARDAEIVRLEREISQLTEQETRLAEAEARERFAREDVNRILLHAAKVRNTPGRFRPAVVERHVARIERLVLHSFQQLVRKKSLVVDLHIDPQTFALDLRGADTRPLTPDRPNGTAIEAPGPRPELQARARTRQDGDAHEGSIEAARARARYFADAGHG